MQIVTAKEFRSSQGRFLTAAKAGQLTKIICRGLKQVKLIREGKLPKRNIDDLLNEL